MSSDSGERRQARPQTQVGPHPPEAEHLACPRCNSTNTKFCYYNNYNLSQPRHFCKSCRRYWTQGGTLRNIPVGGGSRKNSKRSRTSSSASSSSSSATHDPLPATPISVSADIKTERVSPLMSDVNLNEDVAGGFTSLLNSQAPGFLALGGFGLGIGQGFDEAGFGLGRAVWAYPEVGEVGIGGGGGGGGGIGGGTSVASSGCNTWQMSGVESGLPDGDCFGWPDLAISMPGKGLK
ncbi:hypothetical protein L1049_025475 [Liquidambar formosana]|uniref:Dof zinc finger protein n=1 Tax=Liquidambar formosana TaxID=63359 RepID=A0AAP0NCX9_LIQFO